MSYLGALPATPPAAAVRVFLAVSSHSPTRYSRSLHCALWVRGEGGPGSGRRQVVLRRCFSADEPGVAGDGGPSRLDLLSAASTPCVAVVLAYLPSRRRLAGGEAPSSSAGGAPDCRRNRQNRTIWFAKPDSPVFPISSKSFRLLSDSCSNRYHYVEILVNDATQYCLNLTCSTMFFPFSYSFCIIDGPETIEDFAQMQSQEIQDNIKSRRNKIFLSMEEVRRLRVQQRLRTAESKGASSEENEMPEIPSTIPFMHHALELKLGLGGTSYEEFIQSMHLPLHQVDPIVASFSGGAVGVISVLMLVEVRNVRQQEKKRCTYCHGTGDVPDMLVHRNGNGQRA